MKETYKGTLRSIMTYYYVLKSVQPYFFAEAW